MAFLTFRVFLVFTVWIVRTCPPGHWFPPITWVGSLPLKEVLQ